MTTKTWLKDVLLFCVVLSGIGAIAAYLLATDRIQTPPTFDNELHKVAQKGIRSAAKDLDQAIEREIEKEGLLPTGEAPRSRIFRRLSLALAGTLPSVEELRKLESVEPNRQIDWYVSHLLEDRRTADYLAERFARVFVGVEEGPFLIYRRSRFVSWLAEQIQQNTPFDDLARTMLTSKGIWTDKPEVNFYTYNIIPDVGDETKPDPIRLAGRTSRAFLGMRIDCLQCHDDFLGTMNLGSVEDPVGGTQLHFHALASFFSQVENSLVGIRDDLRSGTYKYKLLDEENESKIAPSIPFNSELDDPNESNLRIRLANWLTHKNNRPFARAAVNRFWAIMFGNGMLQPVDDIPLEGPFPPALETLVDDFIANDYDIHRLIRIIANSKTFQRESGADFEVLPVHETMYAVFPMSRLRPEQVAGSIVQSTSLSTIDSTSHIISRLIKFGQETEFVSRFGDPGEEEFNLKSETITQRLLMMNGEMISDRLTNGINSVTRVAGLSPNMEKAVETVYLATLSRQPTNEESTRFAEQLEELSGDERNEKISDLFWTLINSVEFAWNH